MDNPFVYGEVVPGESFVDREAELDRLVADLGSAQKVFDFAAAVRKSSLVWKALEALGGAAPSPRSHRQQLQFLTGVPRGTRGRSRRSNRMG